MGCRVRRNTMKRYSLSEFRCSAYATECSLSAEALRGVVKPSFRTEYGQTEITVDTSCPLFDGLEEKQLVLMSHGDAVAKLPDGFKLCAKTGEAAAVVWSEEKNIVALQFPPRSRSHRKRNKDVRTFSEKNMCVPRYICARRPHRNLGEDDTRARGKQQSRSSRFPEA